MVWVHNKMSDPYLSKPQAAIMWHFPFDSLKMNWSRLLWLRSPNTLALDSKCWLSIFLCTMVCFSLKTWQQNDHLLQFLSSNLSSFLTSITFARHDESDAFVILEPCFWPFGVLLHVWKDPSVKTKLFTRKYQTPWSRILYLRWEYLSG